jgi:uncharacterized protein YPO0396
MLKLSEIRVVNWHGYQEEICRIDGSTLLTGQNGVGKTTLLDAVQYALVANQTQVKFNKANENSRRTLNGYCRWHVSAEEEGSSGRGRYIRGACTSYVMLGFTDDQRPDANFVCGVVVDTTDGDSIREQRHFVAPRARVSDIPAVGADRKPLASRDFKAAMLGHEEWKLIPDATRYQEVLRHRLGFLPTSFQRLLVKALDFKPIGSVRPFIMDFLLEEIPIETDALIRNVENYQRLEGEAHSAERRIAALGEILQAHEQLMRAKDELQAMEYMVLAADAELKSQKLEEVGRQRAEHEVEKARAEAQSGILEVREQDLARARDVVVQRLSGMGEYQQRGHLALTLDQVQKDERSALAAAEQMRATRGHMYRALDFVTGTTAQRARQTQPEWFRDDPFADSEVVERSRKFLEGGDTPDGRRARSWNSALEEAVRVYGEVAHTAARTLSAHEEQRRKLHREKAGLEEGRVEYPLETTALLHLLGRKLGADEEIRPLCEAIEVNDPEWRDAAEGMLGVDRFALLVPARLYGRAKELYRRHKDGYALPGYGAEVRLHSAKIVDVEGAIRDVRSGQRPARPGSLAEKIDAHNEIARAYIDFSVGNVICERDLDQVQKHARAVTPDVMVHQGHATWRMNPRNYARQYIGVASRTHRLNQIALEVNGLLAESDRLNPIHEYAKAARQGCMVILQQLNTYRTNAEVAAGAAALRTRAEELRGQIDILDRSPEMHDLVVEKERLEGEATRTRDEYKVQLGEVTQLGTLIRVADGNLPRLREEHRSAVTLLTSTFPRDRMPQHVAAYEARYAAQRVEQEPAAIEANFAPARKGRETQVINRRGDLRDLEIRFENDFKFPAPAQAEVENVVPYRTELTKWEESELPRYRERIEGVRKEARDQLARDYLFQLYDSFQTMEKRFADMNDALKASEANMGWGRYRFEYAPVTKSKHIYELVLTVGTVGPNSLWEDPDQFASAHEDIERLADGLLRSSSEKLEETMIKDYREFFDYDLVLTRGDGKTESFKNVAGAGSGGENQVPYYIAIFSALYHMYRPRGKEPGCGLVLLDEAFAKMDEERIESVLGLARHMKLQLMLVTPGDKVATIVPRVETTLMVQRDQQNTESTPIIHRFTREMLSDALQFLEAEGALAPAAD